MVIKLFGKHSILVCLCVLASVVIVTMTLNLNHAHGAAVNAVTSGGSTAASIANSNIAGAASSPAKTSAAASSEKGFNKVSSADLQDSTSSGSYKNEMRAVWVPYLSLNMSGENDKSEKAFKAKFDAIIKKAKNCGMNTLIVQVRPFGDALYKSKKFPWSHVISGTQGVDPGYDPLSDMVEQTHKADLKIHAWVNPLRIQTTATPSSLSENNPYNVWKNDASKTGWTVDCSSGKYYNPAYEGVRNYIADGVAEIAKNYNIDGIQFDDYFYPTQDAAFDKKEYGAYCETAKKTGTPLSLLEWRRGNINALVSLCYRKVKSAKSSVPFGIAPQANVQNDLNMGADVYSWCSSKGYVDYICPQLYVNFENPVLPFGVAAQTWKNMVSSKNINLYFGIALYKANSNVDSGTWKKSDSILASEVKYGRSVSCNGFMFYSCDYLDNDQTKAEVDNMIKTLVS